jgi:MFS family permease
MRERTTASVVLCAGVAAAVSLGKFTPFLDELRKTFGLSLGAAALLTSGITVVAAVAAGAVGRLAGGPGARPVLALGLAATGAGGLLMAAAGAAWQLFALRLLEAAGFVAVMVAGPALLSGLGDRARREWALALWGMCVPAGLAVAAGAGGLLAGAGWRLWLAVPATVSLLLAAVVGAVVPRTGSGGAVAAGPPSSAGGTRRPVWLLAAGFAAVSMTGLAMVTLLPSFLADGWSLPGARAAALTSVVAAASIPGSVLAGLLVRRGVRYERIFLAAAGLPVLGAGVFLVPRWPAAVAAAGLLMLVNGVVLAAAFAALPVVAGPAEAGRAAGTLTQLGSAGTLLGPPLFGAAAELAGWWATVPLMALTALPGAAVLSLAAGRGPLPAPQADRQTGQG